MNMTTTTENTTFEERLQARLKQMGDPAERVYTEEQRERNRQRYKDRTEEQIEAGRERARDRYHDQSPIGSRVRIKRRAAHTNECIAQMVEDSKQEHTAEVHLKEDNMPQRVLYSGKTEAERKTQNEKKRTRYANRTEEEKEKQRERDREIYHQKHSDAKYRSSQYKYVPKIHKEPPAPEWYIDACEDSEARLTKEFGSD